MLTISGFLKASSAALERVLGLRVDHAEAFTAGAYLPARDETAFAALRFVGDYSGAVHLLMRREEARTALRRVLSDYAVGSQVESSDIFAELLNMYAAHVLTEMQPQPIELDILPPSAAAEFAPGDAAFFVRLCTNASETYLFCYEFDAGKSPL